MAFFRLAVFALPMMLAFLASPPARAAVIDTQAEHALLMDAATGQILWEKAGEVAMPPASMSKLMTVELLFQRLKDGRIKMTDTLPVSEAAWKTGGSKGFVMVNERVPVQDLIRMIIIMSANDACVVVAEALGGTVENFAAMMNARAKELGLTQSHFVNPDGLPEPPGQMMSALDLAKLARHLIRDYPEYYHFFSEHSFTWSKITQVNRNQVLEKLPGADGLKTGHTDAAGYGVTASAVRGDRRFILVLNGLRYPDLAKASPARADWFAELRRGEEAARILEIAFREFQAYSLFKANEVVGQIPVWGGSADSVPATLANPLSVTVPVSGRRNLKVAMEYDGPIRAPIAQGQRVGILTVSGPGLPTRKYPLYAAQHVSGTGIIGRIGLGIRALVTGQK